MGESTRQPTKLRTETKILIIEDNPADAKLVEELLSEATGAYHIDVASTLADGLAKLENLDVDVILLDLSLPDSFGFRTLTALREAESELPVVVMTGYGDENFESRALHEGAQGYISKNDMEERLLRRMIRRAIIRKSLENELQITYRFLKITNRHTHLVPLAQEFVQEIRAFTGCEAARIRVWDRSDKLHELAGEGFPDEQSSCDICEYHDSDACCCVRVASGQPDPANNCYTTAGSFFMESRYDAEQRGDPDSEQAEHACLNQPYQSVALVPICCHKQLKGIIHLADCREYMLSVELVELLEKVAMHFGAALDRIRTEEALTERETEVFAIFEGAPMPMIAVDESFCVRSLNRAAMEFCGGVPVEHAVNRPLGALLNCWHYSEGSCRQPSGEQCLKCPLHQLLVEAFDESESPAQEQISVRLRRTTERQPRYLAVTSTQLRVAGNKLALLYFQDVSHMRDLEVQQHAFRTMVNCAGERMYVVDLQLGHFIEANRALCRDLGMSRDELLRLVYDDIVVKPGWKELNQKMARDDTMPFALSLRRRNGTTLTFNAEVHPYALENHHYIAVTETFTVTGREPSIGTGERAGYQNA